MRKKITSTASDTKGQAWLSHGGHGRMREGSKMLNRKGKRTFKLSYFSIVLILSVFLFTISGCLDFGKDEETLKPTKQQISYCRKVMFINQSCEILPLGFKYIGSGIDDAIWFKFETKTKSISEIFDMTKVDTTRFEKNYKLTKSKEIKWWDVSGKKFIGGQASLPAAKFMEVAIRKEKDKFIVYIIWFET